MLLVVLSAGFVMFAVLVILSHLFVLSLLFKEVPNRRPSIEQTRKTQTIDFGELRPRLQCRNEEWALRHEY
jgi:hypothetical protein